MSASCYPESIKRVLQSEGGYVNHPSDPGGETNFGITIAVARANGYQGPMKSLPIAEARRIYKSRYADPCNFDDEPAGVDYAVFDYAVNSGVSRANKVLRRVIALPDDAPVYQVLGQLSTRDPKAVVGAIDAERLRFLQSLKTWPIFGKGWGARVKSVNAAALKMAEIGAAPMPGALPPVAVPVPEMPQGKGVVPKPDITKPVATGGTIGGSATGVTLWDWIAAHPWTSAGIGIAALVAVVLIAEYFARRWQASKQDAPTPSLIPVPELKAA